MNKQNVTWAGPEINKAQLLDIAIQEYHADHIFKTPTLSPSQANVLIQKSPAHLWLEHPRLGNQPRPISNEKLKKMEEGTLLHKLILGAGKEYQIIVGFDDFKKKEARDLRDEIRASGHVPVLECVFDNCVKTADAVRAQLTERGIELSGKSEAMIAYQEEADNKDEVLCRIMPDHFIFDQAEIYELKLIFCAHPQAAARQVVQMGYDIQMFAYISGLSMLYSELLGRLTFYWIFAEPRPPHAVTIARPSGQMLDLGRMRWAKAINLWNQCLKVNQWPDYTDGVIWIDPPAWAMKQEMEELYNEPPDFL